MRMYVTISVPEELLPQVTAELLSFTYDANDVEIVHGPEGREIHADPAVADAWFLKHNPPEPRPVQVQAPAPAPEPVPPVTATPVPPAPKPSAKRTASA